MTTAAASVDILALTPASRNGPRKDIPGSAYGTIQANSPHHPLQSISSGQGAEKAAAPRDEGHYPDEGDYPNEGGYEAY